MTEDYLNHIVELYNSGKNASQVARLTNKALSDIYQALEEADKTGMNVRKVERYIKRYQAIINSPKVKRINDNKKTIATKKERIEQQRQRYVDLHNSGLPLSDIAQIFGFEENDIFYQVHLAYKDGMDVKDWPLNDKLKENLNNINPGENLQKFLQQPGQPLEKILPLYNTGLTAEYVAESLNLPLNSIRSYLRTAADTRDWIRTPRTSVELNSIIQKIITQKIDFKANGTLQIVLSNFNEIVSLKEKNPDLKWSAATKRIATGDYKITQALFRAAALEYLKKPDVHSSQQDLMLKGCKLLQQKLV